MRWMTAARTSASSGLMTSRRSVSVLDGAICSSGMSSRLVGRVYWIRLWWLSSVSSSMRIPGVLQGFHRGPGPERSIFLAGEVLACAGVGVFDPDPGGGSAVDRRSTVQPPGVGECVPGGGGLGRAQPRGVGHALVLDPSE